MSRLLVFTLVALLVTAAGLLADIFEAKVKQVDPDGGVLTVTIKDKEKDYPLAKDVKVVASVPQGKKDTRDVPAPGGLRAVKEGSNVMVWTESRDGQEVVTQIRLQGAARKK